MRTNNQDIKTAQDLQDPLEPIGSMIRDKCTSNLLDRHPAFLNVKTSWPVGNNHHRHFAIAGAMATNKKSINKMSK